MNRVNAYLLQVCNTNTLVHLFSSVLRHYEQQMFIVFYEWLVINVISNSPLSVKHPAICHFFVVTGLEHL